LVFLDSVRIVGPWRGLLLLQLATGLSAFRLDGERLTALWSLSLQQLVYRQLMYLVVIGRPGPRWPARACAGSGWSGTASRCGR